LGTVVVEGCLHNKTRLVCFADVWNISSTKLILEAVVKLLCARNESATIGTRCGLLF